MHQTFMVDQITPGFRSITALVTLDKNKLWTIIVLFFCMNSKKVCHMGDIITVLACVNPIVPIFLGKDVFQPIVAFDYGNTSCRAFKRGTKLYIPSTLNIDLILWLIVCAENVKSWCNSWVFPFTFQAYILPHTLNCMCFSLFKFHVWILEQF